MKKLILLLFIFSSTSMASDLSQAKLSLVGKTLLEYSIFKIDVYDIAYYKVESPKGFLMELTYKRDIDRDISNKGWTQGLEKADAAPQLKWLKDQTADMKENDVFRIWRLPENKTVLEKNGKVVATSEDPKLHQVVHYPWIGEHSVDSDLKKKLLGK